MCVCGQVYDCPCGCYCELMCVCLYSWVWTGLARALFNKLRKPTNKNWNFFFCVKLATKQITWAFKIIFLPNLVNRIFTNPLKFTNFLDVPWNRILHFCNTHLSTDFQKPLIGSKKMKVKKKFMPQGISKIFLQLFGLKMSDFRLTLNERFFVEVLISGLCR